MEVQHKTNFYGWLEMANENRSPCQRMIRRSAQTLQPLGNSRTLCLEDVLSALGEIVAADRQTQTERTAIIPTIPQDVEPLHDNRSPIPFNRFDRLHSARRPAKGK